MLRISDIFRLKDYFSRYYREDINSKICFEFVSDECADYRISLEHGADVNNVLYACWEVFLIRKTSDGAFDASVLYKSSYKDKYPDLPEDNWYTSKEEQNDITEALDRICHDQREEAYAMSLTWEDAIPPKQIPMTLYCVEVYDTLKGMAWVWAKDANDAYDKGLEFKNAGRLYGTEHFDYELEINEESNPSSVALCDILNDEEKNDV